MSFINKLIKTLLPMALLLSCSDEEFSPQANNEGLNTTEQESQIFNTNGDCAQATFIKPKVDFLFVWDNSSSYYFINSQTTQALQSTINKMSGRFDYHILLAPLLDNNPSNPTLFLMADQGKDDPALTSEAKKYLVSSNEGARITAFGALNSGVGGSLEKGFERTTSLLNGHKSNGIFREGAYTFVIMMSNGDDNSDMEGLSYRNPTIESQNFNQHLTDLLAAKAAINSQQFRFISLVAHQNSGQCSGFKVGGRYIKMSQSVFNANYPLPMDQTGNLTADSYNICGTNFVNLFDGPNNSIQETVIAHVYNHWVIPTNGSENFIFEDLQVSKNTGQVLLENDANGFEYIGYQVNKNTRLEPTPGEPYTGHMIRLKGSGKVTWPECVNIQTKTPTIFYGYVPLDLEPKVETIKLTINGNEIPQDAANGWQYVGYRDDQNIKVKGPNSAHEAGEPALRKSGYFLKLNGSAIAKEGQDVQVKYVRLAK